MPNRKRITGTDSFGDLCFLINDTPIHSSEDMHGSAFDIILHRLFEYEQAEEHGEIIRTSGDIDVSGTVSYTGKAIREWAESECKRGEDPYIQKFYDRYFGKDAERVPNDRVYYFVNFTGMWRSLDLHGTVTAYTGYSIRRDTEKSPRLAQPNADAPKKWRK